MLPYIIAIFVVCFLIECLGTGWKLPVVKTWPIRVLAINAVQLG